MAATGDIQGYDCEFIDSVPDICYCKKCSLVAKKLSVASCCGESYCYDCIRSIQQQEQPCPECGKTMVSNPVELVKYQVLIQKLKVNCGLKSRGCDWSGTVEQLEAHLDPDQDNCQYVDTKCPLNCQQAISKNKVEQHVRKECVKREHVCQHCNFKATYEEVVDTHLPECMYVPLQCPNLCGVTCDREVMEDHMKICRLEEVTCEFSDVGCGESFRREDQEEHGKTSTREHLIMTASTATKMKEEFQVLNERFHTLETRFQQLEENEHKLEQLDKSAKASEQQVKSLEAKFQSELEKRDQEISQLKLEVETIKRQRVRYPLGFGYNPRRPV